MKACRAVVVVVWGISAFFNLPLDFSDGVNLVPSRTSTISSRARSWHPPLDTFPFPYPPLFYPSLTDGSQRGPNPPRDASRPARHWTPYPSLALWLLDPSPDRTLHQLCTRDRVPWCDRPVQRGSKLGRPQACFPPKSSRFVPFRLSLLF
jgi:hypothetical protein